MFRHIKSDDIESEDLGALTLQRLLSEGSISFARMKLKGELRFTANTVSDIYYYILAGTGSFTIGDQKIDVNEGDIVFIPKNTKYRDEGDLTLLAVATPPFDSKNTVYFD